MMKMKITPQVKNINCYQAYFSHMMLNQVIVIAQ